MGNIFTRVKEALSQSPDSIIRELGLERKGGAEPGWSSTGWSSKWVCPCCDDKGGSASITRNLFLKCHQCGIKKDVFGWLAQVRNVTEWEVCKDLAQRLNVKPPKRLKQSSMPGRMTRDVLAQAVHDLHDLEEAAPIREFLKSRKLYDPQKLMALDIGWIQGNLTFAHRNEKGRLLDRYRIYDPERSGKWMWAGRGSGGVGFWPAHIEPHVDKPIHLFEGEFDVLTSIIRLGWETPAYTWTAGASSAPHANQVPTSWHSKEIHICYDNDVFQGTDWDKYYWPDEKTKSKVLMLRATLMEKLAPTLASLKCDVIIRQVPIPATRQLGADFRDWVDEGGTDFNDWLPFRFSDIPPLRDPVEEVTFDESFERIHNQIRTKMQVETIASDDIVIPTACRLECPMSQHPCCSSCRAPRLFPEGLIHMADWPRELATGLASKDPGGYFLRSVVQRPRACPAAEIVPLESISGSQWTAGRPGDEEDTRQRTMLVVSKEPPSLSGEVEVTGTVYPTGKSVMLMGEKVVAMDRAEIDIGPLAFDLHAATGKLDSVDAIDEYLDGRWRDLSQNVTKVYGRRDILIAHELLMHSCVDLPLDGLIRRGWLDISIYGDTRSGKSQTIQKMFQHHGLGTFHTAVNNISRPGLVMGINADGMTKPGLFPKNHQKAVFLDEWHFACQDVRGKDHPMTWLQGPRDSGFASGIKISGDRKLPAKVRFGTIANWAFNRRGHFEYPCEHLNHLYGAPETLARIDFGLSVQGPPSQDALDSAEQVWTAERTKALILRSWAQKSQHIVIDPDAVKLAVELPKAWKDLYASEELPLFTPEEKAFSILRIAVAVANVCFSHTKDSLYTCHVRKHHVQWAANWLKHTWAVSGYEQYSQMTTIKKTVDRPLEAEKHLTVTLELADPDHAEIVLSGFMTPFVPQELQFSLGLDPYKSSQWVSRAKHLKIFRSTRAPDSWQTVFVLTAGGRQLVQNILTLSRDYPAEYAKRYKRLQVAVMEDRADAGPDMLPLDVSPDLLTASLDDEIDNAANLHQGPGAGYPGL